MRQNGKDPRAVGQGQGPAAPRASSGLSLLVLGPTGTATFPVPESGSLVLGRAEECDVRIDDGRLSRKHAALRVGPGKIELVDLGSLNGSFVRDERVAPNGSVEIAVGESITLGSTVIVLRREVQAERPRHVWNHAYFEARLEEECARASRSGATFAVLRLRTAQAPTAAQTETQGSSAVAIMVWLREEDLLAQDGPTTFEILLIGASADVADRRARDLAESLTSAGTVFDLAVAAFPRDARTPETIVEHLNRRVSDGGAAPVAAASPVGTGGVLERMGAVIARVAAGTINVLILGETGVGKEVLARKLHERSPRAKQPMVSINCAALSESLLESELFGHEKGAFTGAIQAKVGLLESANGGTVFLDEMGEMPLVTQAKLLRVLEAREVTGVGALRPRPIDVRFVAATNRDLEAEVVAGRFRQDLYFRLNGIALSIPPLRERVDEIEPLARLFIERACRAAGRSTKVALSREALEALQRYAWPGNIRELRNVLERAVLLCSGDVITMEHLPVEKMGMVLLAPRAAALLPTMPPVSAPVVAASDDERARVVDALERSAGNQSQAAKLLGISRGTLIKRIAEYALRRPRKREE